MEAYAQEDSPTLIWESSSSNKSIPLGRIMNTVLSANLKELEAVIRPQTNTSQMYSKGSLGRSLTLLNKHVAEIVQRKGPVDQVLIPLLEHAVKFRGARNRKQVQILLKWLSQKEEIFILLGDTLQKLLMEGDDHRIILGWCVVVRDLVEKDSISFSLFDTERQQGYAGHLFKMCCCCVPRLLSIVKEESVEQDGHVLPRRLSIAAADCILAFTQALTEEKSFSESVRHGQIKEDQKAKRQLVTSVDTDQKAKRQLVTSVDTDRTSEVVAGDEVPSTSGRVSATTERETLLWQQLDNLIVLVQQLLKWSKRSRPLHEKGLHHVFEWLQDMRSYCDSLKEDQYVSESQMKIRAAVLSACWKQYGKLMLLEDYKFPHVFKETLGQFISALQYYTHNNDHEECPSKKQSGLETRSYFLACISLLLGRLDIGLLENALAEIGPQLLNVLFAQLRQTNECLTDLAVNILRSIIFRSSISLSTNNESSFGEMETLTPLLIELLDQRDSAARAVVLLIAEYFSINPDAQGLKELFVRLNSDNSTQRRNALDVISELMAICSQSGQALVSSLSQNIAKHLLDRLGDEELSSRIQASKLFAQLDPLFVLPALVQFVYSSDARVRSAASDALVSVLKGHPDQCNVISVLLDCVRNIVQSVPLPKHPGEVREQQYPGSKTSHIGEQMDVDRIMRLVPKWSIVVQDWDSLVRMLLSRMFAEPSNPIIPRFLSEIGDHMADISITVFRLLISHMLKQQEVTEDMLSKLKNGWLDECHDNSIEGVLFDHLSPLLVLRVLPLRAFNDLNSRELYGELSTTTVKHGDLVTAKNDECITSILVNRMCHPSEFKDVRKLAAELTGRLHPQVMLPLIGYHLEHSTLSRDIQKLKACLFAICTSLTIRGKESVFHPVMIKVRHFISIVLLWPNLGSNEVLKAQHGCIDCLALMICCELGISDSNLHRSQSNKSYKLPKKSKLIEEVMDQVGHAPLQSNAGETVTSAVIHSLTGQQQTIPFISSKEPNSNIVEEKNTSMPLAFRLCMANVLISACQKIPFGGRSLLASTMLPALLEFVQGSDNAQMRATCLQVLFTAVYQLKSVVLPYANDLLGLTMGALRSKELAEERIAGAKLMASLMASEEAIVDSIAPNLIEAKIVLRNISFMDTSTELRILCEKLLECMSTPLEDITTKRKI